MDWSSASQRWSSIGGNLAAEIELMIGRGVLPVGEKLPAERELAEKLGVSRTTLREALLALELRGFVSRRPGRGTIVLAAEPADAGAGRSVLTEARATLGQTMELRSVVEPGIAALAAARGDAAGVDRLEAILAEAAGTVSATRLAELDVDFHTQVAAMSGNDLLVDLMGQVSDWAGSSRRLGFASRERTATSLAGHDAILAAIRAGDADAARAAMAEHIGSILALVDAQSSETI
ncbi:FCD domain-containing protein [Agrococcus sp. SL85]|uniref:FadR/GntR family transcriptional regulator n=1 Tax=Agrococcus sp. SL85 TaxID=2995141 RepID=UPI00226D3075|nr:FCD domain-containing protein [Agrococcus sp. SL85]WAC65682.1 FCD domain-containing protein [Agrococcus sp. SL85]